METFGGPSFYNDLEICNSQGIYKNGTSKLQQQIEMLHAAQKNRLLQDNKILVYPNPSKDMVYFEMLHTAQQGVEIRITDVSGRLLKQKPWVQGTTKQGIDLADLAQGIYLYQVQLGTENVYTGKLTIE